MLTNSVKPLYLIFNKVSEYNKEGNGNNNLKLVSTNETKTHWKVWRTAAKITDPIKSTSNNMIKNIWKSKLIQMTIYL